MANILPNDIIMRIIREADGGRNTHKKKMNDIFEQILGTRPIYYYEDGEGNQCPQYVWEDFGYDWGGSEDESDYSDESDEE